MLCSKTVCSMFFVYLILKQVTMADLSTNTLVEFRSQENQVTLFVRLDAQEETVWLNLNQMAELFQKDKSVISRHLKKAFERGELDKEAVVAKTATTASDGKT